MSVFGTGIRGEPLMTGELWQRILNMLGPCRAAPPIADPDGAESDRPFNE